MISLQEMANLTTLYSQPQRHYHNINHINDCLVELENFSHPDFDKPHRTLVESAIWYHDAIYNPYSSLNEWHSMNLVTEIGYEMDDPFFKRVGELVIYTRRHLETLEFSYYGVQLKPELYLPCKVLLDIDLSGFGKPWEICVKHSDNIRKEYYHTSDYDFAIGRLDFLKKINKRESLYYTDHFKRLYQEQSKKNIGREIYEVEKRLNPLGVGTH